MMAMAIACNPRLLIADEPTTALDVTVQAQMLALLLRLQRERGMALVLITHDLGVVAEVGAARDRDVCRPGGRDGARCRAIFDAPRHPYTEALLAALPERNAGRRRLQLARRRRAGRVRPAGAAACSRRAAPTCSERCRAERPALFGVDGGAGALLLSRWPTHADVRRRSA